MKIDCATAAKQREISSELGEVFGAVNQLLGANRLVSEIVAGYAMERGVLDLYGQINDQARREGRKSYPQIFPQSMLRSRSFA
jgi:hypothetical protein